MSKKNKREMISVSKAEKYCVERCEYVQLSSDEIMSVRMALPLTEALTFVNNIVESVFDEDTGEYRPEVLDFVVRLNTLSMYGNITLPANLEKQYEFVYNTPFYEEILGVFESFDKDSHTLGQYWELINAARAKIDYRRNMHINSAAMQVRQLVDTISTLTAQTQTVFSGTESGDFEYVKQLLEKLDGVDEAKLAKIVMEERIDAEPDLSDAPLITKSGIVISNFDD